MVEFHLKNVSRNKKKNLTLEIPKQKVVTQQSSTAYGITKTSHQPTSTNSQETLNALSSPSLVINNTAPSTINANLSVQIGNQAYLVSKFLQDVLISWRANTGESYLIDVIKDSFYRQVNGGTPSEVVNQYGVPQNQITSITDIYGVWYSNFSVTGTPPNRFINYDCRILARVQQPAGFDCDGTPNNSNQDGNAPLITLIQNIPFQLTFDEGTNSTGTIQFQWIPSDMFVTSPNGGQKQNPNYVPPSWFGPNYFVCLPTEEDVRKSFTQFVYSPSKTPSNYTQVWSNPLTTSASPNSTLTRDPKLYPPLDSINVGQSGLQQISDAWNAYTSNQNKSNNNPNAKISSFGEVLGIYYYNGHPYFVENYTGKFNCIVWHSTIVSSVNSSTEGLTWATNYYCTMFEYWVGFGPSTYTGLQKNNYPSYTKNQNNTWIYNGGAFIPTWTAKSTSPNFSTTGPARQSHFTSIYVQTQGTIESVKALRIKELQNTITTFDNKMSTYLTDIINTYDSAHPSNGSKPSSQQMATYQENYDSYRTKLFLYTNLKRMMVCRNVLLGWIHNPIVFNLKTTSKYVLQLYSSGKDENGNNSIISPGIVTMHNVQTSKTGKTYLVIYTGKYDVGTYSVDNSTLKEYKPPSGEKPDYSNTTSLITYLTITIAVRGDTEGTTTSTFYIHGYNKVGICDFASATGFGFSITKPPDLDTIIANSYPEPSSSSSSSSSSSNKTFSLQKFSERSTRKNIFDELGDDIVTAAKDTWKEIKDAADALANEAERLADDVAKLAKWVYKEGKQQYEEMKNYVEGNYWSLLFLGAGLVLTLAFPGANLAIGLAGAALSGAGLAIGGPIGHDMEEDGQLFGAGNFAAGGIFGLSLEDEAGNTAISSTKLDLNDEGDWEFWSNEAKSALGDDMSHLPDTYTPVGLFPLKQESFNVSTGVMKAMGGDGTLYEISNFPTELIKLTTPKVIV